MKLRCVTEIWRIYEGQPITKFVFTTKRRVMRGWDKDGIDEQAIGQLYMKLIGVRYTDDKNEIIL